MDSGDMADGVRNRASFLAFVRALAADRQDAVHRERDKSSLPYGPGAGGWENVTIDAFLDASVAWAEDAGRSGRGLTEAPSWRAFARFLLAGKFYE